MLVGVQQTAQELLHGRTGKGSRLLVGHENGCVGTQYKEAGLGKDVGLARSFYFRAQVKSPILGRLLLSEAVGNGKLQRILFEGLCHTIVRELGSFESVHGDGNEIHASVLELFIVLFHFGQMRDANGTVIASIKYHYSVLFRLLLLTEVNGAGVDCSQ